MGGWQVTLGLNMLWAPSHRGVGHGWGVDVLQADCKDDESGSTATMLIVDNFSGHSVVGWVGDSPAIACSVGGRAQLLGEAHVPSNAKEAERIAKTKGFIRCDRVLGVLAVTRAFGHQDLKDDPSKNESVPTPHRRPRTTGSGLSDRERLMSTIWGNRRVGAGSGPITWDCLLEYKRTFIDAPSFFFRYRDVVIVDPEFASVTNAGCEFVVICSDGVLEAAPFKDKPQLVRRWHLTTAATMVQQLQLARVVES